MENTNEVYSDVVTNPYDEKENATNVSKCPGCGANLAWSPIERCLYCEHCGTKVQIDLNTFCEELDFSDMLKDNNTWASETHVYRCNNCGAKEILAKNEIAKQCSFCGTTNIVETDELSGIKPNAVIPFKIDRELACEKVKLWAKKKWFAPKKFKKGVYPEEIKGNYNPAFTFDTNTHSIYSGRLGKYYYVSREVNGKTVSERRVEYFRISGEYSKDFDDLLIQASSAISQKDIEKISPFDTNNSNQYSQEFLHGFSANQYSKDGHACWTEARKVIEKRLRSAILSQYIYDFVDSLSVTTSCSNIKYKYVLLPVYVGHCNFRTKLYNFFVNGFSGRVTGKTPISILKVGFVTLLGLAAAAGIGLLIYFFG